MAFKSVKNSIPLVLQALATLLTSSLSNNSSKLEDNGLEHGIIRAEQGYDLTEIVQEYSLLRDVILTVLEPDLVTSSGGEILQTVKLIDSIIDRVIALSLESFVEVKLRELKQLQTQLILTNQELTRLVDVQKDELQNLQVVKHNQHDYERT